VLIVGTGALIVKATEFDVAPPGFVTMMVAVLCAAIRFPEIEAVNWLPLK
jgi:hypothetical protein